MANGGSWGYLTPFLQRMLDVLVEMARAGQKITYEELAGIMGVPHWRLGSHLGRLSHWERDHGRPHISAIVVNRDGSVGPGYWTMTVDEMDIRVFDKDEYLSDMQRSVFTYWRLS